MPDNRKDDMQWSKDLGDDLHRSEDVESYRFSALGAVVILLKAGASLGKFLLGLRSRSDKDFNVKTSVGMDKDDVRYTVSVKREKKK